MSSECTQIIILVLRERCQLALCKSEKKPTKRTDLSAKYSINVSILCEERLKSFWLAYVRYLDCEQPLFAVNDASRCAFQRWAISDRIKSTSGVGRLVGENGSAVAGM